MLALEFVQSDLRGAWPSARHIRTDQHPVEADRPRWVLIGPSADRARAYWLSPLGSSGARRASRDKRPAPREPPVNHYLLRLEFGSGEAVRSRRSSGAARASFARWNVVVPRGRPRGPGAGALSPAQAAEAPTSRRGCTPQKNMPRQQTLEPTASRRRHRQEVPGVRDSGDPRLRRRPARGCPLK